MTRVGLLFAGLVLASFISLQYIAVIPLAYATVWIGLKHTFHEAL